MIFTDLLWILTGHLKPFRAIGSIKNEFAASISSSSSPPRSPQASPRAIYVCFVPLSLIMQASDGRTLTPDWSRKTWKLILELGRKWSRDGVLRWSGNAGSLFSIQIILFQQEHACLPGSWWSARIIILCQDHDPLPRPWSSASNMILLAKFGLVLLHKWNALKGTKQTCSYIHINIYIYIYGYILYIYWYSIL